MGREVSAAAQRKLLADALNLLSSGLDHSRGAYARTPSGDEVDLYSDQAARFCAIGVLARAKGRETADIERDDGLMRMLLRAANKELAGALDDAVIAYSDSLSCAEMKDWLTRAIEATREGENEPVDCDCAMISGHLLECGSCRNKP